jgi:hypothetical protein
MRSILNKRRILIAGMITLFMGICTITSYAQGSDDVYLTVQIKTMPMASPIDLDPDIWRGLVGVKEIFSNNTFTYAYGHDNDMKAAKKNLKLVEKAGFKNAKIIGVEYGVPVTAEKAQGSLGGGAGTSVSASSKVKKPAASKPTRSRSTSTKASGSSLTLEGSQVISNFKFFDSNGVKAEDYISNFSGAYNVGYQFKKDGGFLVRSGVGMRKAGATLIFDDVNYNWSLQYMSINAGLGYAHGDGRFKPYITVAGYVGFLLKANQSINNEEFDIKTSEEIQNVDIGIIPSIGTQIQLADEISAYTEFSYLIGLKNIETSTGGQESTNVATVLTLGLAFSIK